MPTDYVLHVTGTCDQGCPTVPTCGGVDTRHANRGCPVHRISDLTTMHGQAHRAGTTACRPAPLPPPDPFPTYLPPRADELTLARQAAVDAEQRALAAEHRLAEVHQVVTVLERRLSAAAARVAGLEHAQAAEVTA